MKPLRIGIAGLGTVGGGALKILTEQAAMLSERCGRPLTVVAVSARAKNKKRAASLKHIRWEKDALKLASAPDIDVIVEAIGAADGIAKKLVEKALDNGKSVVTANKALIAHHGIALAALAEKSGAGLAFEAAVCGGIPIIRSLRDGLAANRFRHVAGILNGTCNYILTSMWEKKCSFAAALKAAQDKGYAEADPGFDIDGVDSAHKLAILAALAYGCPPAIDKVYVEGIRRVSLLDMQFADELGYVIKLLGIASENGQGLMQRVHPCMVRKDSPLATVQGAYNAVIAEGDAAGTIFFEGLGAGAGPTASSVVADLMDMARGQPCKPFALSVAALKVPEFAPVKSLKSAYYLRLCVLDQPGVMADITAILRREKISMRSVIQHSHAPGEKVQVVLTTHETGEAAMLRALAAIEKLKNIKEKPYMIRMETL